MDTNKSFCWVLEIIFFVILITSVFEVLVVFSFVLYTMQEKFDQMNGCNVQVHYVSLYNPSLCTCALCPPHQQHQG